MDLSPSELILARSRAFTAGDFGRVYDSYHSRSNFCRQFTERDDYIRMGQQVLSRDFQITRCDILDERIVAGEAQVIYLLEMLADGVRQRYAELAWLRREKNAWRYHRGQKIAAEDLPASPETLTFVDFENLDSSTIF